jgi:MFS family permease
MDDLNNVLVLSAFAGCLLAVIVGYLLAWRPKRTALRRAGSLTTAAVAGFAGLVALWWAIGAVMPLPLPDGSPLWQPLVFLLGFSPFPLGAFYICAKFIRQALRDERKS